MTKSEQFLMEAFAGESQANRKYLAFAKQAEKVGYPEAAKLFRAAAAAETVHAHAHLRVAGSIRSTTENLQAAIAGETHGSAHVSGNDRRSPGRRQQASGTELHLRQRGGKDSRRPLPKGLASLDQKSGGRGLLRVFGVRLHL